ncbi:MAG: ArsA family ATPase [Natronomonas sp.]
MTRYVLYGGKGGVGKTTCAAATALGFADGGESTLVVSTDPAHSLSDAFEADVGSEPTPIDGVEGLWAVEVDPEDRIDRYQEGLGSVFGELEDLGIDFGEEDLDDIFEAGVAPGADEVAALDLFVDYMNDPRFDRVVFDTAPTGHTLRLLKLPEVAGTAVGKLAGLRSQVQTLADSARAFLGGGDGNGEPSESDVDLGETQRRLERVASTLRDPELTEFRVVFIPETMAVLETERLLGQLEEFEVPVGQAVANKVIENPTPGCELCESTKESHERHIADAEERFGLPVTRVPRIGGEVYGIDGLRQVAERIRDGANT